MNEAQRQAPLYVTTSELAVWLGERFRDPLGGTGARWSARCADGAADLVEAVALALTFPFERSAHLDSADRAVVRLRERIRLCTAHRLLSPRAARYASGQLATAGRMIGGWKRRRRSRPEPTRTRGGEPDAVPTA